MYCKCLRNFAFAVCAVRIGAALESGCQMSALAGGLQAYATAACRRRLVVIQRSNHRCEPLKSVLLASLSPALRTAPANYSEFDPWNETQLRSTSPNFSLVTIWDVLPVAPLIMIPPGPGVAFSTFSPAGASTAFTMNHSNGFPSGVCQSERSWP